MDQVLFPRFRVSHVIRSFFEILGASWVSFKGTVHLLDTHPKQLIITHLLPRNSLLLAPTSSANSGTTMMFLSTAYLCSDLLVRPILTVSSRQHLHYFADASVLSHKPVPTGTDSSSFSLRSSAASLVSFPNEVSSVIILLDTSTIAKRQAGSGLPGSPAACQSECTGFTEVFNRCLDLDRSGCLQVCSIDGWNNVRLSFCCTCLSDSLGDETCSSADTEYPPDPSTDQAASCLNCDLQYEVVSAQVYEKLGGARQTRK
jgi:hypothetical protein